MRRDKETRELHLVMVSWTIGLCMGMLTSAIVGPFS
jgi:hypothetical protein